MRGSGLALVRHWALAAAVGGTLAPTVCFAQTLVTWIGPGAGNPLGTRWIGLNEKGYGIHGTDRPGSIGSAASHGCIRLRNEDVEQLFERVRAGDVVELHAERSDAVVQLFGGGAR